MVAVCLILRIGFPQLQNSWSGATPSRALGQLGGTIPRRAVQPGSLSEAATKSPAPVHIAYRASGFLFVATVALILIAARYLYGVASRLQVHSP
jgi:hypothetical protein